MIIVGTLVCAFHVSYQILCYGVFTDTFYHGKDKVLIFKMFLNQLSNLAFYYYYYFISGKHLLTFSFQFDVV